MANFRKSFNFRNGVQVDNDNLVVNANGLVGIGTTIPTEALDVRGSATVSGLVTAASVNSTDLNVTGVGTFGTITDGSITISSGIITAVSGVVTFYGDGVGLVNIPTSQWIDTDVGLGFTSIYAAGNVGVGTTDPRNTFQVGSNPNNSGAGVGINSTGGIRASGVITATSFDGNLAATNLTGTISENRFPSDITISGVVTATTFLGALTGTATTASSLSGTPSITVDDVTAADISASNVTVSGISTTAELNVGSGGTALTALNTGRLGIGTAVPGSELQIRKASGSLLEVVSDSGEARVSVGQSVGVGNSTGTLRFGTVARALDVVNNDTGDLRSIIHAGDAGISTGNFKWLYGQTNAERMTLTWDGNLGINQTSPEHRLHVVGTSTVTSNAWVGGNLNVAGNITGTITFPSLIEGSNLNNTTGITTLNQIRVTDTVDFEDANFVGLGTAVGIGTDVTNDEFGLVVDNNLRANYIEVMTTGGINANAGVVTAATFVASGGFGMQGISTAVEMYYQGSPDRIIFNVVGIGSTSLRLF